ncbi:uncharacterized protein LOC144134634 [Amblyomma americanum]
MEEDEEEWPGKKIYLGQSPPRGCGLTPTNLCDACGKVETLDHFLLYCPKFALQRKIYLDVPLSRFTEEDDKVFRALQELPNALEREQKKRSDIHEGTLLAIDENVSRMSEDHDTRMERMERTEELLARVHKEMLEQIEEERRRRHEELEKERFEYEQRQRDRSHQRYTLNSVLQGMAEVARYCAPGIRRPT